MKAYDAPPATPSRSSASTREIAIRTDALFPLT
jgi:hypothetical protein